MRVAVLRGAAWNRMIHVERLPDGRGATIHPLWHHEAIGGSAAGKALNLARLGVEVTLHACIGETSQGGRCQPDCGRPGSTCAPPSTRRARRST